MRRAVLLFALAGCAGGGADAPPAVNALVGEIHLHQFPLGAHAWAGFVERAVPVADVRTGQLAKLEVEPTASEGVCTLYAPRCRPECGRDSYCSGVGRCTPLPTPVRYVDAGEVRITGSAATPLIRLWFPDGGGSYLAEPEPGEAKLFAGGEKLVVRGGRGDLGFEGTVRAPLPVVVTQPDLARDLRVPEGAMVVRWQGEGASEVIVTLSASAAGVGAAAVRCVTADIGEVVLPATMLAALPPSPRDVRLEVERNQQRVMATGRPGVGVVIHASFSAWQNGRD